MVDDLQLARYAARMLIAQIPRLRWVGEASNLNQAVDLVRSQRPQLAIVDVELRETDGAAVTRAMLRESPDLCVIAWSVSEEGDDLLRMLGAGARGYMLKESGPSEFARAIETALGGDVPIPRRVAAQAIMTAASTHRPFRSAASTQVQAGLTPAELRVLTRLVAGDSIKLAAAALKISPASVDSHVRSIYRKLNAGNRAQAIRNAIANGLVALDQLED